MACNVDGIRKQVWMEGGEFEQTLYEVVTSSLTEGNVGIDIISAQIAEPLTSVAKHKACKFALW